MAEENLIKTTTISYFACRTCKKKMSEILMGSTDLFGFGSTTRKLFYCDDKDCDRYGDITVVGIKIEE